MDYKAFGRRIREKRKELHLSQEALAVAIGLSASFMGHIERGTRIASIETLVRICNVLHVSPNYLLFGNEETSDDLTPSNREELISVLDSALEILKTKRE